MKGGKVKCKPAEQGLTERIRSLIAVARENPWWEFDAAEIGEMMNLPENTLAMLIRADKSPFEGGRSRPERVAEFFRNHPGWKPSGER